VAVVWAQVPVQAALAQALVLAAQA